VKKFKSILCLLTICGLISCADKKATNESKPEQTSPPVEVKVEEEGVVIKKQVMEDSLKGSLKAYVKGRIGTADFKITYHSPAVRGRIVWGGLVPFDKVWVTGAHMATTIESSVDFTIGDKSIVAGKYGFFTIPGKDKWVVIINTNWQQHLTDEYDSKEDIARIEVVPIELQQHQERLQYEFVNQSDTQTTIYLSWDKLQLQIPVTVK
jgi:hypothetical protein